MEEVTKKGVTTEQSKRYLEQSGVIDKKGQVTEKYQGVLKVKKDK